MHFYLTCATSTSRSPTLTFEFDRLKLECLRVRLKLKNPLSPTKRVTRSGTLCREMHLGEQVKVNNVQLGAANP